MEITIRHLSGSRAGQIEKFDAPIVRIGRSPDNDVTYDPERDRLVSGFHAELINDAEGWLIRDPGSSNGTFIGGERITERRLRRGDVIRFGADGPEMSVDFGPAGAAIPGTIVEGAAPGGAVPRVGNTVLMTLDDVRDQAAGTSRPVAPTVMNKAPRRRMGIGKLIAITLSVLFFVLIAAFSAFVMVHRSNTRRERLKRQQQLAQASKIKDQIEEQKAAIAQNQVSLQQAAQTGVAPSADQEALRRSLADAQKKLEQEQAVEAELLRKLQITQDELANQKSRAPEIRYRTKYVVAPSAGSASGATGASGLTPASGASNVTNGQADSGRPAIPYTGKVLKKRLAVLSTPSAVALPDLPSSVTSQLVTLFSGALESTDRFLISREGQASVGITVTNYRMVEKARRTSSVGNIVGAFGRAAGTSTPQEPAAMERRSYDVAIGLSAALFDPAGHRLASAAPRWEIRNAKSAISLEGTTLTRISDSDNPLGDALRKVVADSVDALLAPATAMEWMVLPGARVKDGVVLPVGRSAGVDIGDVFEAFDAAGRSVAFLQVRRVGQDTSDTRLLTTGAQLERVAGVRYAGSVEPPPPARSHWVVTTGKASLYEGPGKSFKPGPSVAANTRLRLEYAVGSWARVSPAGKACWVALNEVQLTD